MFLTSMPSLQLGVDDDLDLRSVSPLDGDERLIAVDQLSTDVNICVYNTRLVAIAALQSANDDTATSRLDERGLDLRSS